MKPIRPGRPLGGLDKQVQEARAKQKSEIKSLRKKRAKLLGLAESSSDPVSRNMAQENMKHLDECILRLTKELRVINKGTVAKVTDRISRELKGTAVSTNLPKITFGKPWRG